VAYVDLGFDTPVSGNGRLDPGLKSCCLLHTHLCGLHRAVV
jgi:hypothetical protein